MLPSRDKERSVVIFRSGKLFEVEAIAQELEADGIRCHIDGRPTASAFSGLTALDGVTQMQVVVLEGDAERAREIAERWLYEAGDDA